MNQFHYQGWWWLPNNKANENKPVAGTLSFSNEEGLQLQLFGTIEKDGTLQRFPVDFPQYDLLWGRISEKNQSVTIVDCQVIHANINVFDPSKSVFTMRCSFAYVGQAWLVEPDEKLQHVQINCSYLLDWAGRVGFEAKWVESDNKLLSSQVTYNFPKSYVAATSEYEIKIDYALNQDSSLSGVSLQEQAQLNIKCPNAMSTAEWLHNYVNPIQNLISLAVDRPVSLNKFTVFSEINKKVNADDQLVEMSSGSQMDKVALQAIFRQISHSRETKLLHNDDVLFSLKDVEIALDKLIDQWLRVCNEYDVVCNLYFSTRRRPQPYLSGRFLVIAQAAEIFHRIKFPDTAFPVEEFRKRKKAIVQSAPENYREWLQQQLAWSNELSLKQRIQKLYEYTASVSQHLISNPEAFVIRVRDTRNYYTHYSSKLQEKAADHVELHWLTEVLRYTVAACLLYEIGFSIEKVEELFLRNENFKSTCREISSLEKAW